MGHRYPPLPQIQIPRSPTLAPVWDISCTELDLSDPLVQSKVYAGHRGTGEGAADSAHTGKGPPSPSPVAGSSAPRSIRFCTNRWAPKRPLLGGTVSPEQITTKHTQVAGDRGRLCSLPRAGYRALNSEQGISVSGMFSAGLGKEATGGAAGWWCACVGGAGSAPGTAVATTAPKPPTGPAWPRAPRARELEKFHDLGC